MRTFAVEQDNYGAFDIYDGSHFTRLYAVKNGWFDALGAVSFDPNTTSIRALRIIKNGGGVDTTFGVDERETTSFGNVRLICSARVYMNKGDYVELEAYQYSGASLHIEGTNEFSPVFSLTFSSFAVKDTFTSVANAFAIFTGATLPDATYNTAYSAALQAIGASSYYWDISAGSLPSGMSLTTQGALSGTSVAPGDYTFTGRVARGSTQLTRAFTLRVGPELLIGLKASWKLGEASGTTRVDSVAAHNLTDHNSVQQVTGKVGNAAEFASASSRWLSVATHSDLEVGDNDFTIGFWFYFTDLTNDQMLVAKDDGTISALQREWFCSYAPSLSCLRLCIFDTGNNQRSLNLSTFGNPALNTWCCFIAWYDKTAHKLRGCINNGTVDEFDMTGFAVHAGTAVDLTVGRRVQPSSPLYFDGRLDNLNLWKKVLTSGERASFYNSGSGREHPMT